MTKKISVVIERDTDGFYAYCPELPGCQSQGTSKEDVISNIREAASLYMKMMSPDERKKLPPDEGR